jgi:hypothetical protein
MPEHNSFCIQDGDPGADLGCLEKEIRQARSGLPVKPKQ